MHGMLLWLKVCKMSDMFRNLLKLVSVSDLMMSQRLIKYKNSYKMYTNKCLKTHYTILRK